MAREKLSDFMAEFGELVRVEDTQHLFRYAEMEYWCCAKCGGSYEAEKYPEAIHECSEHQGLN